MNYQKKDNGKKKTIKKKFKDEYTDKEKAKI